MFKKAVAKIKDNKDTIIGFTALTAVCAGSYLIGSALGELAGRALVKAFNLDDINTEN